MISLALIGFGAVVGILSGVLGIGGGVVLVPGLMLLFGFSQVEAQGTSLAVMIPPIGIFAALVYYQHGYVRLPIVGLIALGFLVGAFLGAKSITYLPVDVLRVAFGGLLLYLGLSFLFKLNPARPAAALPEVLAAAVAMLVALVLHRRRRVRRQPEHPPGAWEYHI